MAEVQASDRPSHPPSFPPPNDAVINKPPVCPAPLPAPGDVMSATIESLRARLLAERAASKEARQQAQKIAEKVSELQTRLDAEMEQRRKSELAMLELLEILKAKGLPLEDVISTVPLPLETLECEEIGLLVNGSRSGDSEKSYSCEVIDIQPKEKMNGSETASSFNGSGDNKEEYLQNQSQVRETITQAKNEDSSSQQEGKSEHHKDDQTQEKQKNPIEKDQIQVYQNDICQKVDVQQETQKELSQEPPQTQEVDKFGQSLETPQKQDVDNVGQSQETPQIQEVENVGQSWETSQTQEVDNVEKSQTQYDTPTNKSTQQTNTDFVETKMHSGPELEKVTKGESEQGEHGPSEGSVKQDSSSETESQASSKLPGDLPSSARVADQRAIYGHEPHGISGGIEQSYLSGNNQMQHAYLPYSNMLHPNIPPVNGSNPYDINVHRNASYYMPALPSAELGHWRAPYAPRELLASDLYPSQQALVNDSVLGLVDDKRGKLGDILAALHMAKQQLKDESQLSYLREERFKPSMAAYDPKRYPAYGRDTLYNPQPYRYMRPETQGQAPIVHLPASPKSDHGASPFDRHEGLRRSSSVSANFMMPGSYFQSKGEVHLGNGITLYTD